LCGTVGTSNGKTSMQVNCPAGTAGGYIKVVQARNYLTICELEAYGTIGAPSANFGTSRIRSVHSGLALDVAGYSKAHGGVIH